MNCSISRKVGILIYSQNIFVKYCEVRNIFKNELRVARVNESLNALYHSRTYLLYITIVF